MVLFFLFVFFSFSLCSKYMGGQHDFFFFFSHTHGLVTMSDQILVLLDFFIEENKDLSREEQALCVWLESEETNVWRCSRRQE